MQWVKIERKSMFTEPADGQRIWVAYSDGGVVPDVYRNRRLSAYSLDASVKPAYWAPMEVPQHPETYQCKSSS